jgi:hypothetical protein
MKLTFRQFLKQELQRSKKRRTKKELAKKDDPLNPDDLAGLENNGPDFTQSDR